jgi:NADPH-dependent 2,4-dienoyl-CoA reductase/sulfur reductase-like enzyme
MSPDTGGLRGAVGCEFASIVTAPGVEVTLPDNAPRLLPFMDGELSDLLAETFRGFGMRVLLHARRAAPRAPRDPVRGFVPALLHWIPRGRGAANVAASKRCGWCAEARRAVRHAL